jgi:hypothetical protein
LQISLKNENFMLKTWSFSCCIFLSKCTKTHVRASVTPKNFSGSLALTIKGTGREGRGGEGRGGKERRREKGIVESKKSLEYGLLGIRVCR